MTICCLQSATTSDWAQRKLARGGRWLSGRLRGIAKVYLPYRLYAVQIHDGSHKESRGFAVDAAAGTLDAYQFPTVPDSGSWLEIETRNCHPVNLKEHETRELAVAKARRFLFSRGFFRVACPRITAELVRPDFYIPYWIGFYGNESNVSIKVLNAVRQTVEGNKIRRVITTWLMQDLPSVPALTAIAERNPGAV